MTTRRPKKNGPHLGRRATSLPMRLYHSPKRVTGRFGLRSPDGRSRPSPSASAATPSSIDTDQHPEGYPSPRRLYMATPESAGTTDRPSRLPLGGFTCCLTLSSECFSTFPHGTCALSVSCRYLALDGVYHPPLGCATKQPDSRKPWSAAGRRPQGPDTRHGTEGASIRRTSAPPRPPDRTSLRHSSRGPAGDPGIRRWALPASLAATGGILVSFSSSA